MPKHAKEFIPTTLDVRNAYAGQLFQVSENVWELADEDAMFLEFDKWLIQERNRVAEMAIKRERERILKLISGESQARR